MSSAVAAATARCGGPSILPFLSVSAGCQIPFKGMIMLYLWRVQQGLVVRVLDAANRYPRFSLCRPNFSIAVSLLGARLIVAAAAFHPQPLSSLRCARQPSAVVRPRNGGLFLTNSGWPSSGMLIPTAIWPPIVCPAFAKNNLLVCGLAAARRGPRPSRCCGWDLGAANGIEQM